MNKKIMIWIFVLILLSVPVMAVAPITTIFTGETGLRVLVAPPLSLEAGGMGATSVYVYNYTNAFLFYNGEAGCNAIIDYPNGSELVNVNATSHEDHYDFTLNLTGVEKLGEYSWMIRCNVSEVSGFRAGYFDLTIDGQEINRNYEGNIIMILLAALIITFGGLALGFRDNKPFMIFFLLMVNLLMVAGFRFATILTQASNISPDLVSNLVTFYQISIYVIGFMMFASAIYLLILISNSLKSKRDREEDKRNRFEDGYN